MRQQSQEKFSFSRFSRKPVQASGSLKVRFRRARPIYVAPSWEFDPEDLFVRLAHDSCINCEFFDLQKSFENDVTSPGSSFVLLLAAGVFRSRWIL